MPEQDHAEQKDFHEDIPAGNSEFHVKGAGAVDWGMKNRLARVFRQESGRTVMLAVDHGYFQGPTSGLERIDLAVPPLLPYADALMCTRGTLRATVSPAMDRAVVMRASGGPSVLKELSDERIAIAIEDAVRLNVSALAVQVFVGGEHETQSVSNLTRLVDSGLDAGIPVMGVVAVGKEMAREARYFRLACRMIAELGAQIVKCYYTNDGFSTVAASCPVPIVMAGGKKIPEADALAMASQAIREGAAGVDMGRNIFQSEDPVAMIQAVQSIVHQDVNPTEAYELFEELRGAAEREIAPVATA